MNYHNNHLLLLWAVLLSFCSFCFCSPSHYSILGLPDFSSPTARDLRKAYHKLALKYHPDRNKQKSAESQKENDLFVRLSTAYGILSDDAKKREYDQVLKAEQKRRTEVRGGGMDDKVRSGGRRFDHEHVHKTAHQQAHMGAHQQAHMDAQKQAHMDAQKQAGRSYGRIKITSTTKKLDGGNVSLEFMMDMAREMFGRVSREEQQQQTDQTGGGGFGNLFDFAGLPTNKQKIDGTTQTVWHSDDGGRHSWATSGKQGRTTTAKTTTERKTTTTTGRSRTTETKTTKRNDPQKQQKGNKKAAKHRSMSEEL
eukprot:GHVS01091759.1.p1 GENE.GHVS01091759.1~~GHVS01091759.1.p1  ORF type:complete len:310 (+),score=88.66 GHVS01091759.1:173-1102(+)